MKLVNFKVDALHDYLDLEIPFKTDLTFLIGTNGSGKTSALRLISAMTTCDLKELLTLKFKQAELRIIDDKNHPATFSIIKEDRRIVAKYNGADLNCQDLFLITKEELRYDSIYYSFKDYKHDKNNDSLESRFKDLPSIKKISSFNKIIFLDTSRTMKYLSVNSSENSSATNKFFYLYQDDETQESKVLSIDKTLKNIQAMIYDRVRKNAMRQEFYAKTFKNKVLQEYYSFIDTNNVITPNDLNEEYIRELERKREELKNGMKDLCDDYVIKECETFFDKFIETIQHTIQAYKNCTSNKISNDFIGLYSKVLTNSILLDKFDKILKYCKIYNEQIENLKSPFTRLCESVNKFFRDTNKTIIIDKKDELKVKINEKISNSPQELSSGEKQLIAIFADMALNVNNHVSTILIDEPDLSLHIAWQENLVDALRIVNPNVQYVLATHSPSIISKIEWRNNTIDLTRY